MKIRFQKDMRPLIRVTIGTGWSQADYGLSIVRIAQRPSFERFSTGTWYADLGPVSLWRMAYTPPQTVGEAGVW